MRCLILVAHGSRRATSNDEVRRLAALLQRQARGRYDAVVAAFLELAEPGIPAAIDACVARGARPCGRWCGRTRRGWVYPRAAATGTVEVTRGGAVAAARKGSPRGAAPGDPAAPTVSPR